MSPLRAAAKWQRQIMGIFLMNQQERNRLATLNQVKQQQLTLARAAQIMNLSYRQAKRIWRRYRQHGDKGLVHGNRGRPSARRFPQAQRTRILARYAKRYPDFGPTLAAEHLAAEGLAVDHETLRRWLLQAGLRSQTRTRRSYRQWRERKACFGELVQLDGSQHDWFEGRRTKAVLMVMVDDATNHTYAQMFEGETTRASYDVLEGWANHYGLPVALYVDRDSIYRAEGLPSLADQLAGRTAPQTQFERAMATLGVDLILANSPQAKGRVERRHQVFQDRLIKELRLAGINEVAAANRFLRQQFLPALNRRFTVVARSPVDVHRPPPGHLDEVLSWEEPRVVQRDWTVGWQRRWFQIERRQERHTLVAQQVTVRELRTGQIQLLYRGKKLHWRELPARPQAPKPVPQRMGRSKVHRPGRTHPWRAMGGVDERACRAVATR